MAIRYNKPYDFKLFLASAEIKMIGGDYNGIL